jgi:hypothetical protein
LIYKKFLLRTDAAALNKVLHKELKNPGDHKFSKWQALFINFDFSIEHIKGTNNSLADFLSREHLQIVHQALIVSVQLQNNNEHIENIPDSLSWDDYCQLWVPRWGLRQKKTIGLGTQFLYSTLVPEVRRREANDLLSRILQRNSSLAQEASLHLTEWFHDIKPIWQRETESHKEKYLALERPRSFMQWPEQNAHIIFPETFYEYPGYSQLWWNLLYEDNVYYILKFGGFMTNTRFSPPSWLYDWWLDFSINKEEADPNILSHFFPLYQVRDINYRGPNDYELYMLYIQNHLQWALQTRTTLLRQNGVLTYNRRIYTKAWDTLLYPEKFSTFIEND